MPPLLSAALLFSVFVPKIIDYLSEDDPYQVASKTIQIAQELTQCDSPEEALLRLRQDPLLKVNFIQATTCFLLSLEEARFKNMESARTRDMILASMGSNRRADWMVVLAALGLVAALIALTVFKTTLSGETVGIISTIAGIFGSCLKDAFGFEFGSSRSSREKDLFITKQQPSYIERGPL